MREKIEQLIEDLKKAAKRRDQTGQRYFSEELAILRLKAILKEDYEGKD